MNTVLTINNNAILVNGKAVMYKVNYDRFVNRITVARQMMAEYPNCFGSVADAIQTLKSYEKDGNFVFNNHTAYILHDAN